MTTVSSSITIDIDTGGTFTDGTISDGNQVLPLKVLTTPHDLTVCFHNLIKAASTQFGETEADLLKRVESIRYSTTIGTNTILQRNGPRIGLIVLAKDLPRFTGLHPESLLGSILSPAEIKVRGVELTNGRPDRTKILEAVEFLLGEGAERLVVSISDEAADTESTIKRILFEEYPRHILGALPILFSTELTNSGDIGRRTATAVLNAYLHPSLEHFLYNSEDILRTYRYSRPLFIFGNDGTSNRVAKVTALKTYNSGPTGGVEGAVHLARYYKMSRAVSIDIGGTSTDLAFIVDGEVEEQPNGDVEGETLSFPLRQILALGGGGGTIAQVVNDEFRLGPESAGASPGPACFGFGGTEATVTDANLVLGYFRDETMLAGQVKMDGARARQAVAARVGEPLGLTIERAALLIRDTLEERIGQVIRREIEHRGFSPSEFTLMAFGGAGPLHAAGIASRAGIKKVMIPDMCSVFSAFGIGFSDVVHRYARTVSNATAAAVTDATRAMIERAYIDMRSEGFAKERVGLTWSIQVGNSAPVADVNTAVSMIGTQPGSAVAIALEARSRLPHLGLTQRTRPAEAPEEASRRSVIWSAGGKIDTAVYAQSDLDQRHTTIPGPTIVEGLNTTFVVPPGWHLSRDAYDQYFLTEGK